MTPRTYWVYILASEKNGTLYVGVTNSLERRVWEHRNSKADSFTVRYGVNCLVYFEDFRDVNNAIAREKQLKAGSRGKKIALIEKENPEWRDLAVDWFAAVPPVIARSEATRLLAMTSRDRNARIRGASCPPDSSPPTRRIRRGA